MVKDSDIFQLAPSARILTPDAAGAACLQHCLREQASFRSSPLSDTPLQEKTGNPQRVFCESSGSSGTPKLIRRSPASWRESFDINGKLFGISSRDTYAVLGHLGHSLSLFAAVEALHLGCGLAILSGQTPARQALALRQYGATVLYATPSQLRLVISADPSPFAMTKNVICGGGTLDSALRKELANCFPAAKMVEFFGASETSFISLSDDQTPPGSVGRPYPGVELRIGNGCAVGETGEIWVKSPYLFEGYEEGSSALTNWDGGFLSVGEMGQMDSDGYLYLRGRRSRMVTVADQNVFPEAIETVLLAQEGVEAAVVLALADPRRGHRIVAVVQGSAGEAELRRACRAALGDAAVPREIRRLAQMPLLPAGKPDLQRLQAMWMERSI
ncbi:AMP-binding protein [Leisingera daeponensis]|uniref:AMP-binding protein n=1 Tax=Leisingera daeponensis TaxID=405746 RepID=UPI001C9438EB|nr:AMP-binding protein [Leisingera daeponensis]MBY6059409.1 AMP-binding protein [Leisingera daeponensis]